MIAQSGSADTGVTIAVALTASSSSTSTTTVSTSSNTSTSGGMTLRIASMTALISSFFYLL